MELTPEQEMTETEAPEVKKERKPIRPEVVMAVIAAFCAVLFVVMVALCWPFMTAREDPESLARPQHQAEEAAPDVSEEATEETSEEATAEETEAVAEEAAEEAAEETEAAPEEKPEEK